MDKIKLSSEHLDKIFTLNQAKYSIVLDTDTYNEIDDQFALCYAALAKDKLNLKAVYAAPFFNKRSTSPGEGMLLSHEEIYRVLERLNITKDNFVFKGSNQFMTGPETPIKSAAAEDLIKKALAMKNEILYVLSIGAPTNVASALLLEPKIREKIAVIWLGGNPHNWINNLEFNFEQDIYATRILFDSQVPLIQIPCVNVAEHLRTTVYEIDHYLKGKNEICNYLAEIFRNYAPADAYGWSKVIWDISAIAILINPEWVPGILTHTPIINDNLSYSFDQRRHFMKVAITTQRDMIFKDLFSRLVEV